MTSQPLETNRFMMYLTICILTALVSQSIGLVIGSAMSVEVLFHLHETCFTLFVVIFRALIKQQILFFFQSGVFIGPVASVPIVLFSGFFVNFDAIPKYLKFLSYVSYVRYSFEGAMISVYGYDRAKLKCSDAYCHFKSPTKFLEEMSMQNAVFWLDAVALAGFLLTLRVIAYFVLRLKLRSLR